MWWNSALLLLLSIGGGYSEAFFQISGNWFEIRQPKMYVRPCCPCVSGTNAIPSIYLASQSTAVCFPKICTNLLDRTQHLHNPGFNTATMKFSCRHILSHTVVKCKLNHKKLSFHRYLFFFFFLFSVSKQRSSSRVSKDNHPSPWSAEVPKSRNASLGRLLRAECRALVFKEWSFKHTQHRCSS